MGEPGSHAAAMLAGGWPVPALDAPPAAALPDGNGRRRRLGGVRAAAGEIPDSREAADMPGAAKACLQLHCLCLFLR